MLKLQRPTGIGLIDSDNSSYGNCISVAGAVAGGTASTASAAEVEAEVDVGSEACAGAGSDTEVSSEESPRLWTRSSLAILFQLELFIEANFL